MMRELAGRVPADEIAARVGRTKQAIYNKANVLGIKNKSWHPPKGHPWRNPLRWGNEVPAVKTIQGTPAQAGEEAKND